MKKVLFFIIVIFLFCSNTYGISTLYQKGLTESCWHNNRMVDEGNSLLVVYDTTKIVHIDKNTGRSELVVEVPLFQMAGYDGSMSVYKDFIYSLSRGGDGKLYIGVALQMYQLDGSDELIPLLSNYKDKITGLSYAESPIEALKSGFFLSVTSDKEGNLYAGGQGKRIVKLIGDSIHCIDFDATYNEWYGGALTGTHCTMNCDSLNNIWLTVGNLSQKIIHIYKYNRENDVFERIFRVDTNAGAIVYSAIIDNDNHLWYTCKTNCIKRISCQSGGLATFTHATVPEIPDVQFTSISKDKRGNLWFCADSLLMKYDGTTFKTYENIGLKNALCLMCDDEGVWIYCGGEILCYFKEGIRGGKCKVASLRNGNGFDGYTGIEEAKVSVLKPYATGRRIVVPNAVDEVVVYDVMGRVVGRSEGRNNAVTIDVLTSGVYMVKMGGEVQKVVAK